MAEPEETKKAEVKADVPVKKKSGFARKLMPFTLLFTAFIFHASSALLLVCMLPTVIAAIIDRQPQRTAWITVGAMNFAGALPSWFQLLQGGNTLDLALEMATRPSVLMVSYLGAGLGWLIYTYVPAMVASVIVGKNIRRLKDIDKRQKDLLRQWGESVTGR